VSRRSRWGVIHSGLAAYGGGWHLFWGPLTEAPAGG